MSQGEGELDGKKKKRKIMFPVALLSLLLLSRKKGSIITKIQSKTQIANLPSGEWYDHGLHLLFLSHSGSQPGDLDLALLHRQPRDQCPGQ